MMVREFMLIGVSSLINEQVCLNTKPQRPMKNTMHVVFGAAGALGAAIVQNLAQQNKAVRAVVRDVGRACKVLPSSAESVVADASKPDSIKPAFHNVSVIYHCVNVPYDKWTEVMPLVTDNILAGAIERQASVATNSITFKKKHYIDRSFANSQLVKGFRKQRCTQVMNKLFRLFYYIFY